MNDYEYNKYSGNKNRKHRKRKSKREKVGFYVAFAICIVAVGMAVYSTYTGVSTYLQNDDPANKATVSSEKAVVVNNTVTGVTESPKPSTQPTTQKSTNAKTTQPQTVVATDPAETMPTQNALQTMLSVSDSLSFPLDNINIQKDYSEDAVYNKTLNDWRAHPAIDLSANVGDSVYAMVSGKVEDVYQDNFLGYVVSVTTDNYTIFYCGLDKNAKTEKGAEVNTGDVIGTVSTVPYEAMDDNHIHIEIKVDGKYIDPLSVIKNNE